MKKIVILFFSLFFFISVSADAPYPPSSVISKIQWDDVSNIIRLASGSDTWPITWADDGHLYTAYADGRGFDPKVPLKLSLGFARVEENPKNIKGINIRSDDEQYGDGKSGKKASGMLSVNGILYMWVRNADKNGNGCQLAWSTDYQLNWNWATWTFTEFGYCTFINFGKDYSGARDNYIYTISPNGHSAYNAADSFILMRVLSNQITNKDSYEFFSGLDEKNQSLWTTDLNKRAPIFNHSQKSLRSGISYNKDIGRYLWWQQIPKSPTNPDTRSSGGFGIYEASEPWGPWKTVYFIEEWDVGPGETASFPTKWMSDNGKELWLVFSGNDYFSVRKATLELSSEVLTVRSNPQPTGNLPSGTTSTTISLNTNELATCRYSTTPNTDYTIMTNTFSTTGGLSHSQLITGLQDGLSYNFYVRCNDNSGNFNTEDFEIVFSVSEFGELVISDLQVLSGKSYKIVMNGLTNGVLVYIDRSFTFSSIPFELNSKTYIKTANDDKSGVGDAFLSFNTNQDVRVYVAHDDRITLKPLWLSSFSDTGENIITTDTTLSLYKKDFSSGKISLGGNQGTGESMYSVIVVGLGNESFCTANWNCSFWTECINNEQTRTCNDLNNCGIISGKPAEIQSCSQPQPTGIITLQDMLNSYQDYRQDRITIETFLEILRTWIIFR